MSPPLKRRGLNGVPKVGTYFSLPGMKLASEAGEAYQRQARMQMGLGLWHKAITWETATPSHFGGQGIHLQTDTYQKRM